MKLLLSVFAAIVAIVLAPHNAQASSYSNTSGLTQLTINELMINEQVSGPNRGKGSYITKIGATNWSGTFTPTYASNGITNGGMTTYLGTFVDKPTTTGSTIQCSGTIKLDQTYLGPDNLNLSVKWVVTGGNNCPFIGNSSTLLLKPSLPIANASGDFNPSNSTTRFIPTNSRAVWPKWKVVDPTGLNCRVTPTPLGAAVPPTLPVSTVINVTGFDSNGPWLKTSSGGTPCYVRANSTYLKPVTIPF